MKITYKVTDSEWQIMRVLWEKKKCSAAEISEALRDSKTWKPTTVKTFLARLVSKNMINYQEIGKMYVYTPNVSEQLCVISEMKDVLNRVYGGKVHHESEHFQFFGIENIPLSRRLSARLEESYQLVERDFGFHLQDKQMVYLYSSINRLHSALGLQIGPRWLRAGWEWNILHIAPETEFVDLPIESATVHVWLLRVIHEINPDVPLWFQQGIAAYESGWLGKDRLKSAMRQTKDTITPKSVIGLSKQYDLFHLQFGYELSLSVIDFIIQKFSKSSLCLFLQHPQDYEMVFSIDETTFWNRWFDYFKNGFLIEKEV